MDESVLLMAEALAQSMVETGVKQVIARLPQQPVDYDGACVDCGDELPAARIKFGAITCVPCQSLRERTESLTRRL